MATILKPYQDYFSAVTLKPSSGGVFEVTVDGRLLFSKLEKDRFPSDKELDRLVAEAVGAEPEDDESE